ncbi:50S ribosomal protein L3 [Desulfosudis oleivorans]|uniref:Large ribosomal subunit protein uL3 n=1 Tax=Desulfosudis oleivorans (strain DSM 6200 / JCM 39069 / Hxd3) TaxID=96561 RepID=RL3_DESOH|nr:50S ribosomal protein L3 [Desulfosudis oleivorans]A8ZV57.1 RecName: Full=Large ribosomal subunit protein uL3; AltName: Full=50S ribosomal protein L3 [Desulfosudis oleivorans Hxd3]ABW66518.1 ribosomal protein L3 [Desulfosudis oleivorans Hxd3]
MCRGIIGRKIGMTGVFSDQGEYVPVTVIEAGPCVVTQIKTVETDGYSALQLGFLEKKASKINKPLAGHFKKSGGVGFAYVREMAVDDPSAYTLGQVINAELFSAGEKVHVAGLMKGRGFAGVVKRHGFAGGKDTHGCHSHRVPGSIGTSAWPSKVFKGRKLPGRYGNTRITTKNLKIFDIQPETNLILIKGAVPGSNNGLVEIRKINA